MDDKHLIPGSAEDGLGFELLAASLRADETDARAFLAALATKLEGALPAQTRVERVRDGLFKGTTPIASPATSRARIYTCCSPWATSPRAW
jgi:hypothetical protein